MKASFYALFTTVVFISVLLTKSVEAQTEQEPQDKPIARIETIEAKLSFRAFDASGKRVTDLTPRDILLIENGAGRQVTSIKLEPTNILLVLDQSAEFGPLKSGGPTTVPRPMKGPGSYRPIGISAGQEFAERLIVGLGPQDHLAILQYSETVELVQSWTSSREEAAQAVASRIRMGRKARYYDALLSAADVLQKAPEGKKVMILLTDGVDTASTTRESAAIDALRKSGATIYVVGYAEFINRERGKTKSKTSSRETDNRRETPHDSQGGTLRNTPSSSGTYDITGLIFGRKQAKALNEYLQKVDANVAVLERLADETGGDDYMPRDVDELMLKSGRILEAIGSQYTLTYLTDGKPGAPELRKIEALGARPGLSIQTRKSAYVRKMDDGLK